jgi:acyl-CoA dehydrogenase
MEFGTDDRTRELAAELDGFMADHVYPAEQAFRAELRASDDPFSIESGVKEDLKGKARALGLWNLFLPDEKWGAGLTNLQYAPIAEITGRSPELARRR